MNIEELEALKAEYLLTLDDEDAEESYTTQRGFADVELKNFLIWLKARKG